MKLHFQAGIFDTQWMECSFCCEVIEIVITLLQLIYWYFCQMETSSELINKIMAYIHMKSDFN